MKLYFNIELKGSEFLCLLKMKPGFIDVTNFCLVHTATELWASFIIHFYL